MFADEPLIDQNDLPGILDMIREEPGPFVVLTEINAGETDAVVGPFDSYDEANKWRLHCSLQVDEFTKKPHLLGKITQIEAPETFRFG